MKDGCILDLKMDMRDPSPITQKYTGSSQRKAQINGLTYMQFRIYFTQMGVKTVKDSSFR